MKAGIYFTGTGPVLIMTARDSLQDPFLLRLLRDKGIDKFIAFEVPIETVKERYGQHFGVILGDRTQKDDLRVVDEEGHRVFYNFSFEDLGQPIYSEEPALRKAA